MASARMALLAYSIWGGGVAAGEAGDWDAEGGEFLDEVVEGGASSPSHGGVGGGDDFADGGGGMAGMPCSRRSNT